MPKKEALQIAGEDVFRKKICDSIDAISQSFRKDELAYLATTGKIESAFRDRIAFDIHGKNQETLIVAREWKRIDIAILETNGIPVNLIELKSAYSFDGSLGDGISRYLLYLKNDLMKAGKRSNRASLTAILIVTHLEEKPGKSLFEALKYYQWHRKAGNTFTQKEIKDNLLLGVETTRITFGFDLVKRGEIPAGTAFGIHVTVFFWVLTPNYASSKW